MKLEVVDQASHSVHECILSRRPSSSYLIVLNKSMALHFEIQLRPTTTSNALGSNAPNAPG